MRTDHPSRLTEIRRLDNLFSLYHCACGTEKAIRRGAVNFGNTRSCGCLSKEVSSANAFRHGMKHTHEHGVWGAMKQRCSNPKNTHYHRYGGRGITVCASWKASFQSFFTDMGLAPTNRHTIERNDNDGNYCKDNCRWATYKEQAANRSSTKWIEFNGVRDTPSGWSVRTGIARKQITKRLMRGWTVSEALTIPMRRSTKP